MMENVLWSCHHNKDLSVHNNEQKDLKLITLDNQKPVEPKVPKYEDIFDLNDIDE
jgi:hypothetical protein